MSEPREAYGPGGIHAYIDRLENAISELESKNGELEAQNSRLKRGAKEHLKERKKYRDFMKSSKTIVDALKDEGLI